MVVLLVHPLGCGVMCIREGFPMFRSNLLFPFVIHRIKFTGNVVRGREKAGPVLELCESLWDMWP